MDKYDNLMIRACKSGLPKEKIIARLLKIWAMRCDLPREYSRPIEMFLYEILELVDKYNPLTVSEFCRKLTPFELIMIDAPKDADTMTAGLYVCISHLKFTEHKKLPGYVAPIGFRRKWEKARIKIIKQII